MLLCFYACKKEHVSSQTFDKLQAKWLRAYTSHRFYNNNNFISSWDTSWLTGFYIEWQKDGKYVQSGPGGFIYSTDYKIISDSSFFIYTTAYRTPEAPKDTFYMRKLTESSLVLYRKKMTVYTSGWSVDEYIDSLSR